MSHTVEDWNHLLFWLSAQGNGSIQSLESICTKLNLDFKPDKVRRQFQLLGHLEVKPGAKRWSVTRSVLVKAAMGEHYFLTGQRSASAQAPIFNCTQQLQGPDRWSISSLDLKSELTAWGQLADVGCTSEKLLEHLESVDLWRENLVPYYLHQAINSYFIEKWNFELGKFQAYSGIPGKRDHGVYRLKKRRPLTPMDQYPQILYWDGGIQQWLIADFTGMCFAHIHDTASDLDAIYRAETGDLWIPKSQRWPYIYERCLVLASGLLAQEVTLSDRPNLYLHYVGIPHHFMNRFEYLLDLELESI